jgi:septal ring factor EnvC (AmiA/AmiB activator)
MEQAVQDIPWEFLGVISAAIFVYLADRKRNKSTVPALYGKLISTELRRIVEERDEAVEERDNALAELHRVRQELLLLNSKLEQVNIKLKHLEENDNTIRRLRVDLADSRTKLSSSIEQVSVLMAELRKLDPNNPLVERRNN